MTDACRTQQGPWDYGDGPFVICNYSLSTRKQIHLKCGSRCTVGILGQLNHSDVRFHGKKHDPSFHITVVGGDFFLNKCGYTAGMQCFAKPLIPLEHLCILSRHKHKNQFSSVQVIYKAPNSQHANSRYFTSLFSLVKHAF